MSRTHTSCALCEKLHTRSICANCVNYRLNEYNTFMKSLCNQRDSLLSKLNNTTASKGKADDQLSWRMLKNEKLAMLKEKLRLSRSKLYRGRRYSFCYLPFPFSKCLYFLPGKAMAEKMSHELKSKHEMLESAMLNLERNRVEKLENFYPNLIYSQSLSHVAISSELIHKQSIVMGQLCKLFPQRRVTSCGEGKDGLNCQHDQICNARLPGGLDPHSVPSEELSNSLGNMVQLVNLAERILAAPVLHNSGFAGSCSRIWQRHTYWDPRPSDRSSEYPLFIPRQRHCISSGENSWSERSSSNFDVSSVESERPLRSVSFSRSGSFNSSYTRPPSPSLHAYETHKDLQKGISLFKKSIACITAYGYNSLFLDVPPPEDSTFEAFSKLLSMLSSPKDIRSLLSSKMASSREFGNCRMSGEGKMVNRSVWGTNSATSRTSVGESQHGFLTTRQSYVYPDTVALRYESFFEGWDVVDHPTLPPPPSQADDIDHWIRAMFIDARTS